MHSAPEEARFVIVADVMLGTQKENRDVAEPSTLAIVTRNGMFAGRFTPETNLHAIDESEIQCE
jgi:hypothetical protein